MDDDTLRLFRTQQLAVVHLVCLVVHYIIHRTRQNRNEISLPTRDMRLHRQRVRDEMLSSLSSSGKYRDKELEEEVLQEVLNATQEEDTHAPREIDDRGEQIRSSIANEMWSDYSLYLNNESNV
ncbi:hypothetical protein L6452_18265 [Arctium lappa]|uniref:Uncharacterized protein n=1 Tax=Arctium lappa TaxID=4217 RepID=A0ACB9C5N6_ARCLA|nr:hypothetical protein L6452_18265 [Arctium lappa]